jgi:hypothetical protein
MTAAGVGSSSVPERDVTKDVAEGQHDHGRSDEAAAAGSNAAIS